MIVFISLLPPKAPCRDDITMTSGGHGISAVQSKGTEPIQEQSGPSSGLRHNTECHGACPYQIH